MHKLDNLSLVKKLDPNNALGSVDLLGRQVKQVWEEFKKISVPAEHKNIDKILINAMGGSALPGHILKSVYFDELKKPVEIINGYDLPPYLDSKTLYIVCSYSGTTEEPLTGIDQAKKRGAKIFGITSGGKLGQLISSGKIPGYIFDPVANPSNQPRIGVGYTLVAHLALFKKLGLIKLSDLEIKDVLTSLEKLTKNFGFNAPFVKNKAKQIAKDIAGKSLLIAASQHLAGNAHVFANQTNETGKTLSAYHLIPELNHHLLEGLKFPTVNKGSLVFMFFESDLYHTRNQFRHKVTQKIVSKNQVKTIVYKLKSKTKLLQSFEILSLSSYITFYIAMENNLNPNLIPWVDLLKQELKKVK